MSPEIFNEKIDAPWKVAHNLQYTYLYTSRFEAEVIYLIDCVFHNAISMNVVSTTFTAYSLMHLHRSASMQPVWVIAESLNNAFF